MSTDIVTSNSSSKVIEFRQVVRSKPRNGAARGAPRGVIVGVYDVNGDKASIGWSLCSVFKSKDRFDASVGYEIAKKRAYRNLTEDMNTVYCGAPQFAIRPALDRAFFRLGKIRAAHAEGRAGKSSKKKVASKKTTKKTAKKKSSRRKA